MWKGKGQRGGGGAGGKGSFHSFAVLGDMRDRALSVSYAAWQPADGKIKKVAVSINGGGAWGVL
jgi:hypothetical protein